MRIRMASDGNMMNPPGKFQRKWTKGTEIDCSQSEADALRQRGMSFSVIAPDKPAVAKVEPKVEPKGTRANGK